MANIGGAHTCFCIGGFHLDWIYTGWLVLELNRYV